jgi:chorismate synthase
MRRGILGGISSGQDIYGTVSFKPTATILRNQKTVNRQKQAIEFTAKGRHDPCVLPRAVPIVEAMINLVLADHLLQYATALVDRLKKIFQNS